MYHQLHKNNPQLLHVHLFVWLTFSLQAAPRARLPELIILVHYRRPGPFCPNNAAAPSMGVMAAVKPIQDAYHVRYKLAPGRREQL